MHLISPSLAYKHAYQSFADELQTSERIAPIDELGVTTVEEYIEYRMAHAKGKKLPEDWVPATTYWLMEGDEVVSETHVRHWLNDHLRTVGGHIGYVIRPSKRNQGYGTALLQLALQKAHKLGINKALLTCDETNIASQKIIEANGGVYETSTNMGADLPKKKALLD